MRIWAAFLILAAPIVAQVTTGTVSGFVVDPAGRPVARAVVVALETGKAIEWRAVTDENGFYRLTGLAPATYRIRTEAPGLEAAAAGVGVAVDARIRLDFRLPLAGRKDSVEVRAAARTVEADSAELGLVLDREHIANLPLNRRDFLQLALLAPGVLPAAEDSQLSQFGSVALHANGAREEFNSFLLDGADNNDPYVNRYVVQPSVDAVQEYKVATNSYSAEYSRSAGAQVNVITRGGSNALHGFLYEYLRNRPLDARNFFDGAGKPRYIRNQFGAGLGGPLVRDRAFYYASADFLRERQGLSRLASVPTQAERRGDLSEAARAVLDPFTRAPFPGNLIPPARISRTAQRVLDLFPLPDRPGAGGNYLAQPTLSQAQSQVHARFDYRPSDRDRASLRYSFGYLDLFEPFTEDSDAVPGFGDFVRDPVHNAMLHHERILGPRTVQSLRLAFGRFSRDLLPQNHTTDVGQSWGLDWLRVPARSSGYPIFNTAGYSRIGDTTSLPILRHTNTYQLQEGLSLVRGRHLLKTGGEVRHLQLNGILDLLTRGSLSFSGALTGLGIGDLLLGLPSFALQAVADNPLTLRTTAYNLFFQDEWRVRPGLTLNLGVRYEYNTPPVDPTNRMSTLHPGTGALARVGSQGISRSGISPDRNNFAPRAGFALSLARGWVLRGGYGIYFDSGMFIVSSAQYFNPPQFNLRMYFPSAAALLTLENPFPRGSAVTPPASLNLLSPDMAGASLHHWSLDTQKSLPGASLLSLAYAASKGTHLVRSRNLNQPRPGPGDIQARRPDPRYGGILLAESGANSSYHSLQASFHRPLARGVSVLATYTWSKSIDDASAFLGVKGDKNFPQDSMNYRAERAASSFDLRQRATAAYIVQLPGKSRWTRATDLRGIVILQTGPPFTPVLRFDNSNTGNTGGSFGWDRPNLLRDPRLSRPAADLWFDAGAFRTPARFTFGTAGRNIVRGAGLASFDLSLVRQFSIRDRCRAAFEAQAFNLINRAHFNLPEAFADEPASFGRVFSAKAPRQLQFALRFSF